MFVKRKIFPDCIWEKKYVTNFQKKCGKCGWFRKKYIPLHMI